MDKFWTDRAIKGVTFLMIAMFLILANSSALSLAKGSPLALAFVNLLFGVVGPILLIAGLYFIGTRHKQASKSSGK